MSLRSNAAVSGLLLGLASLSAWGAYHTPRQYYGHYRYHNTNKYYYRPYYYKPSPSYVGYRHHYAVYYPSRPDYVYYYNPYSRKYWGRCPSKTYGKPSYSLLAEKDRKARLEDIREKSFPPMGEMPKVPEAEDDERMELPPDDLPGAADLPK